MLRSAGALSAQDGLLMRKSGNPNLEYNAAAKAEN
jgi:hypothetical protein